MTMYDCKTGEEIQPFGYELVGEGPTKGAIVREHVVRVEGKDYGCNPLGDGRFRMVPSGDIVNLEEQRRRLNK